MNNANIERVCGIAADILQVSPDKMTLQSCRDDIDNWDSVQHLNLILALEQKFNVAFEPEEMDHMNSLKDILRLVESKVHSS